jgi:hypothetical protein
MEFDSCCTIYSAIAARETTVPLRAGAGAHAGGAAKGYFRKTGSIAGIVPGYPAFDGFLHSFAKITDRAAFEPQQTHFFLFHNQPVLCKAGKTFEVKICTADYRLYHLYISNTLKTL